MHCPRCGQLQVSEEIKFCSRCGFPLGLVSEILAHGGFLPQLADLHKNKKWLTRKNGIVFSILWFIFFVPFLTSIFGGIMDVEELGALCALVGIFGGLMLFIGSLVWLKGEPKGNTFAQWNEAQKGFHQNLSGNANQNVLPPQQSQPAQSYVPPANSWKAPDTGELSRPGSVTEGTTKLLRKED